MSNIKVTNELLDNIESLANNSELWTTIGTQTALALVTTSRKALKLKIKYAKMRKDYEMTVRRALVCADAHDEVLKEKDKSD